MKIISWHTVAAKAAASYSPMPSKSQLTIDMQPPTHRLLTFVLIISSAVQLISACPQSILAICKCISTPNGLRIECVDQAIDEVIRAIGTGAKVDRLSMRNTDGVAELPAQAFGSIQIRELEITGNKMLRISDNAFDATAAAQLASLLLAGNTLASWPKLDAMTNLEILDLSENNLTSIPDNAFANTKKLKRLHVRANSICKLSPNALNETKDRLEFLDLSKNCLDEVPAQNLRGAQKLQYLDLSGNRIQNVPSLRFMNLPALVELRLNANSMEQLHPLAFMNVPNLEQLNLSDNRLPNVDTNRFQSFSKLATLDLSRNRLTMVSSNSFQNVANLRQLILDDNRIESVETLAFSALPALQVISLQNNGLRRLYRNAFDQLPSLISLLFTNNSLSDIGEGTLAGMPALQQLILSNNRLTTLSSGSFDGITQLTTLDLSDNLLSSIGSNVFQSLTKLFWLDLSGNQLSLLPAGAFSSKISNVLLQGNPLVCNESIDWLVQYLVSNNVRTFLPNQQDVRCADPPEKRGVLFKDLMLQKANDTFFNNLQTARHPTFVPNQLAALNISTPDLAPSLNQPSASSPIDVQAIPAGPPRTEDLIKSLPQLAALLGNSGPGGLDNVDLTKLPPEIVRYVAQGGQIPGVSKETVRAMTQRYLTQMAAKNGPKPNAIPNQGQAASVPALPAAPTPNGIPTPIFISFSNASTALPPIDFPIAGLASLPPLNSISPELIQKVLNGGAIPGFTQEQTEAIKRHYLQQPLIPETASALPRAYTSRPSIGTYNTLDSTGPESRPLLITVDIPTSRSPNLQFSPSPYFNFTDLQSLNIDFSKIPPEVLRDLAAGRTPDFGKIPQDVIRAIMEKRPKLFGEIVSRELRTKTAPNGTHLATDPSISDLIKKRPSYDVNDLDKKADISVMGQDADSQQMTIWTGVALGAIGAVTIIAVAVLCWRRRVMRAQRRISRQTQIEDTSDTSKFFDPPVMVPEPAPRRSKFEDGSKASAPATGALADLMFLDTSNNRGQPFGMDPISRQPGGPIFNIDPTSRLNSSIFNIDPLNRVPSNQHLRNVNASNFQAQPHFSPPALPNQAPSRTAVFDHNTGTWMFVAPNSNTNSYH